MLAFLQVWLKMLPFCGRVTWDNPYGGVCSDLFQLSEDGHTLTQVSNMTINDTGRTTVYR